MKALIKMESTVVRKLLVDFYEMNFCKAGVEKGIGKQIVEQTWEARVKSDVDHIKERNIQLFNIARRQANSGLTEIYLWDLFSLVGVEVFIDIGANKLRRVNELAGKYPHVKEFVAIDVVPKANVFTYPDKSRYLIVDPQGGCLDIADNSVNLANVQHVFHHFVSDGAIGNMLSEVYRVLRPGGRLILWEESYESAVDDVEQLVRLNNSIGIETDLELTKRFYGLSVMEKLEFITVNDWILNVNNSHVQWTGLYKEWSGWKNLLQASGFRLKCEYNLGLRLNAMVKQGVHCIGEFVK